MKKVSILVNCYNSEAYLQLALDSIYSGAYQNFEIILVDNCSTDNTASIAKKYDSRLVYVKTDKLIPLYAARNVGLKHVTGDYLAFLDSDDIWLPNKLSAQLEVLKDSNIDFIYTNYSNIIEQKAPLKKLLSQTYLCLLKINLYFRQSSFVRTSLLIKNYDINLQTVILKKVIIKNFIFNEKLNLYGDFDFFLRVLLSHKIRPYYLSKVTSLSRVHEKQLSRKNSADWLKEAKICYRDLCPLVDDMRLKKEFVRSHILMHLSSHYMEKKLYTKSLKIKAALSSNSMAHMIHFLKSTLLILKK